MKQTITMESLQLLVAECEPADAREKRRKSVGRSSGETYEALLRQLAPQATIVRIKPADARSGLPPKREIASFDGVFLTGSPLHLYQESPEARREIEFMREVFDTGVPAFGSCAGLQLATIVAGGKVRSMGDRREAGFARRIYLTEEGRNHPMLAGRPPAFDAPAIHTDEVESLPVDATLLASNATTKVQAAEIRHGRGVFWGVQYHPEIDLREVAGALTRQAHDLIEHGLARSEEDIQAQAALLEQLHADPARTDLLWRLGLDEQITMTGERAREIRNFIAELVLPCRSRR